MNPRGLRAKALKGVQGQGLEFRAKVDDNIVIATKKTPAPLFPSGCALLAADWRKRYQRNGRAAGSPSAARVRVRCEANRVERRAYFGQHRPVQYEFPPRNVGAANP